MDIEESGAHDPDRPPSPAGLESLLDRAPKVVRRSLLLKHALFFFAVVVPVTCLIGAAAYWSALHMYQQEIENRLTLVAQVRGSEIQTFRMRRTKRMAAVAARPRLRNLLQAFLNESIPAERFQADVKAMLTDLQQSNYEFHAFWIAGVDGAVTQKTNQDDHRGQQTLSGNV